MSKIQAKFLKILFCVGLVTQIYADYACYNGQQAPAYYPGTFIQDDQWHQLSDYEQRIMIELSKGNFSWVIGCLQEDKVTYYRLTQVYDLLWITLNLCINLPEKQLQRKKAFVLFLLSQGVLVSDTAIKSIKDVEYANILLEFGICPNYSFNNGDTWLIHAVKANNNQLVNLFMKSDLHKACPRIKNYEGKSAYDYCPLWITSSTSCDYHDMIKALYGEKVYEAEYKRYHKEQIAKYYSNDKKEMGQCILAASILFFIMYYSGKK